MWGVPKIGVRFLGGSLENTLEVIHLNGYPNFGQPSRRDLRRIQRAFSRFSGLLVERFA